MQRPLYRAREHRCERRPAHGVRPTLLAAAQPRAGDGGIAARREAADVERRGVLRKMRTCGRASRHRSADTLYPQRSSSWFSSGNANVQNTTKGGRRGIECSIRSPVEKAPRYLLSLRIELFGRIHVKPRTDILSSVSFTVSFANGHVALSDQANDFPMRAPPVWEKATATSGGMRDGPASPRRTSREPWRRPCRPREARLRRSRDHRSSRPDERRARWRRS